MRVVLIAVISCATATPALAQTSELDKVYACSQVSDSTQRLACYDAAVGVLREAHAAGWVTVVTRSQLEAAQKDAFGLDLKGVDGLARAAAPPPAVAQAPGASRPPAAAAAPPQELDVLKVSIRTAERRPNGAYRFTLDGGQVWEQTDTYDLGRTLKGPVNAVIRKAALGSYMMKVDGKTAVRVKRIK